MVGGISHVVYAALIFIGIHLLSSTPVRATVVKSVGERITIYATAVDGSTLGRAEVDPAGRETPISIRTPDGLEMVTIFWASPGG